MTNSDLGSTPKTGRLHHVEINVSSLEVSLRFWQPLLVMLGYTQHQNWPAGRSFILNGTYLVFCSGQRSATGL